MGVVRSSFTGWLSATRCESGGEASAVKITGTTVVIGVGGASGTITSVIESEEKGVDMFMLHTVGKRGYSVQGKESTLTSQPSRRQLLDD